MSDILVIKLSALGDLVQADGALKDIRKHHLADHITVMTTPSYRRFMERCPWVDEVFLDPRASRWHPLRMLELRRRLRKRRFARVYDLQQVGRTRFYYHFLFPRVEWLGDAAGCTYRLKRPADSCAADHFARHLPMAGIEPNNTLSSTIDWLADDAAIILARHNLRPGFVLLIPGASSAHSEKRWPYFHQLAERLAEQNVRAVTVPGPDELDLCRTLQADMLVPAEGCYDVFQLAGIARQAGFVIGNDTGPTHIAAHLGCRGIALFGGHTAPRTTGIQHTRFICLEEADLADLHLSEVWPQVAAGLQGEMHGGQTM